jgi:hypothetical protein
MKSHFWALKRPKCAGQIHNSPAVSSQFIFKKNRRLHSPFMMACYLGVKWCREGDGRLPK